MLAIDCRNDPANIASRPFIGSRQFDNAGRRKSGSKKSASTNQDERVHCALNPLGPLRCLEFLCRSTSGQEQPECGEKGEEQPEGIMHNVTNIPRCKQWVFNSVGEKSPYRSLTPVAANSIGPRLPPRVPSPSLP